MSTDTMSEAERTRTELAATLGVIQDKLNVKRKATDASAALRARVRYLRDNNPGMLAGLAAAGLATVGGAAYLTVRLLARR